MSEYLDMTLYILQFYFFSFIFLAYRRVQKYCPSCPEFSGEIIQRTVSNGKPENLGRVIHICSASGNEKGHYFRMFPECNCGVTATVMETKKEGVNKGKKFYGCGNKKSNIEGSSSNFRKRGHETCDGFLGWKN